ncbi:hypothetical protein GOP47_0029583 [Adiantum capillus-veneris]|nr:hypothetical protein GOP47_0029583 [Adiantum capillus-veneris]
MGRGIGRLRAVVRQGWASSARQFSSQNSLPQEQEAEPFEVLGLDDITSLITTKCRILVNPISGYGYEEQDADTDPIKIFQSCWGWSSSDECRYEDFPAASSSSSSVSSSSVDPSVLSRKQRMAESALSHDIAASIMQKGWCPDTQQEFSSKVPELTPFHICNVLKAMQDPDLCMQVFDWAKQRPGYQHTTISYNALFGVLAGRKGAMVLALLQEEMAKDGCQPDKVTLCTLIKGFSKAQQPNKVLDLYNQMREKDWVPGVVTYSCIIDILAKHGYTDKAREVYFEMRMSGCYLDKTGYNIIINLFGRTKNLHMVTRLFNDMLECGLDPDGYTYAALIQTHLRGADAVDAYKLFQEALDKKFSMTLATCNALIYALGKAGELDLALRVYRQIGTAGLQADNVTYSTIVIALGRKGRISDLHVFIDDMALMDGEDGHAHATAVEWLVSGGNVDTACKLVLDITKRQEGAHNAAVDALLQSFVKMGEIDQINDFVKNLRACGFWLDASKLSGLVKSITEAGNVDGALKIFYSIRELGYRPDEHSFNSIIVCLSKFGSLFQALRFFDDMIEIGFFPSTDTCNHLIHMLCMKGNMKSATEIFDKMKSSARNVSTYNQLIAGYANSRDWAMAFKLSKDMEDNGLVPDSETYMPLIFSLGNEGRLEHALQLCKQMLDGGRKPSSGLCTKLLEMLAGKGHEEEARWAFTKLKAMGEFADFPDYDSHPVRSQFSYHCLS